MIRFPRAPLIWLLLPLIAGYMMAEVLPRTPAGILGAVALAFAGAAAYLGFRDGRKSEVGWMVIAWLAVFFLAAAHYTHRMKAPDWEGLPAREAILEIKTERFFDSSHTGGLVQGLARISQTDPHLERLNGQRIYFSFAPASEAEPLPRATRLRVRGVLEKVPEADNSGFHSFLRRSGAAFRLSRIELLEEPSSPLITRAAFQANARFEEYLRNGESGEFAMADVYVAMMLGKRTELSDEQRTGFLHTGTLHLFAISGLHIGVIAFAIHCLLTLLRVPPRAGAVIGLLGLYFFVEITGASPSAVRAFLMVFFFWGARLLARSPNPVAALINSAVFVLLLFPYQLWSPGFQLSYSVVSGILFLGLPLAGMWTDRFQLFRYVPENLLSKPQKWTIDGTKAIIATFAISLSATLLSSPLSIHYFEIFAPGAALFNVILVPLAGLVITAGFLSIVMSLAGLSFIATIFNHAAWMVIALMEAAVRAAPGFPGFFWQAGYRVEGMVVLSLGAVIAALLCGFSRAWRPAPRLCLLPFGVFLLFLLTTVRLTFLPG